MKRPLVLGIFSLSLIAGCSGSGFQDGGGENSDEDAKPTSGDFWTYELITKDTCGGVLPLDIGLSEQSVVVADDGSAKLGDVSCTAEGKSGLTCKAEEKFEIDGRTVTIAATKALSWTGADRYEGTTRGEVTCAGESCAALGVTFPCGIESLEVGVRSMPESFAPELAVEYTAAVGAPVLSTCNQEPVVAAEQTLRIEATGDTTAKIFADRDPIPHDCKFQGKGRTSCNRIVIDNVAIATSSTVEIAWTGARSFEGVAELNLLCQEGETCTVDGFNLPCKAIYQIKGSAPGDDDDDGDDGYGDSY